MSRLNSLMPWCEIKRKNEGVGHCGGLQRFRASSIIGCSVMYRRVLEFKDYSAVGAGGERVPSANITYSEALVGSRGGERLCLLLSMNVALGQPQAQ